MTGSVYNIKNQEQQTPRTPKKFPVSAGTAAFLVFNFLLIAGFCKFSFFVLKNHRSALDRDTFVNAYVDIQPQIQNDMPVRLALNDKTEAPAPLFMQEKQTVKDSAALTESPVPVRPPVVRHPVTPRATPTEAVTESVPEIKDFAFNTVTPADEGVSLDSLMESGLDLLAESDNAIMTSGLLLEEEPETEIENKVAEPVAMPEQPKTVLAEQSVKPAAPVIEKPIVVAKKEDTAARPETRWVDIAQLRRELSAQSKAVNAAETAKKNAAMLGMNDSHQTAALDIHTTTDIIEQKPAETIQKQETAEKQENAPVPTAETVKTAVVQDIPFAGTADPLPQQPLGVKTAVVQDIPFAGTAETQPQQTVAANSKVLAGDSSSLWKVAKVRGKPKNALAVKEEEVKAPATTTVAATTPAVQAPIAAPSGENSVIYRNGKPTAVAVNEQKSLNWLDRKEAAVWTSMSQSDTPSVWAPSADNGSSDRVKAFRIADEQPVASTASTTPAANATTATTEQATATPASSAPATTNGDVLNSQPVRIVGEEQKPEAKANPLLLPLGTSPNEAANAAATASLTAATVATPGLPAAQQVNLNGMTQALTPTTAEQQQQAANAKVDDGLVNKIFSFFGKAEEDVGALPSVGSGTPVPAATTEKAEQKTVTGKRQPVTHNKTADVAKKEEKVIVPTELRLTYKPDSSEMSAQTIKWIKAFGQRAKKDIQNAVEVRMSNLNPSLQEQRFAMIRSTLVGVGMENVQIIPIMTNRTPHTIVLRIVTLPEEGYTEYTTESGGVKERMYYKQW